MGCCAPARSLTIRRQSVVPDAKKPDVVVQRVSREYPTQAKLTVKRQAITPPTKCTKCGAPTMTVIIAGRQRTQCANSNCRHIVG